MHDIEAISIKFANSVDETTNALKIAEKFEANHNIVYLENYLSEMPKAIYEIKRPFWDLHWYYVAKESQSISNILASGDGGDEVFGGYTFRYEKFLALTNSNSTPLEKVKAYLSCHERDRVPDQELLFGSKSNFSWNTIYTSLLPYFENSLSRLDQVFLADYNGKLLYNFSPINSRIINAFDMNLLTPLLSEELLSIAPHIPIKHRYDEENNRFNDLLEESRKRQIELVRTMEDMTRHDFKTTKKISPLDLKWSSLFSTPSKDRLWLTLDFLQETVSNDVEKRDQFKNYLFAS